MCEILAGMIIGALLLAGLYPLLWAAVVLTILGGVGLAIVGLTSKDWSLVFWGLGVSTILIGLIEELSKPRATSPQNLGEEEDKYLEALRAKSKRWNNLATTKIGGK